MTQFTMSAGASYRTSLLTEAQATSFARCLRANVRFSGVQVCRGARAKGAACWFVQFAPSSTARAEALLRREQEARAERAGAQAFTFAANRFEVFCYSHGSGNTYALSPDGRTCSCPDAQYRSNPHGLLCKHGLAWLASEEKQEMEETRARREEEARRFDAIFAPTCTCDGCCRETPEPRLSKCAVTGALLCPECSGAEALVCFDAIFA